MNIFIQDNQPFSAPIRWVFALIAANKQVVFNYLNNPEKADLIVAHSINADVYLDLNFYEKINNFEFKNNNLTSNSGALNRIDFNELNTFNSPLNALTKGALNAINFPQKTDFLTPIFYLVNCLQEYNSTELDNFGRFKFAASWQAESGSITENTVQQLINLFLENQPKLQHLATKSRESSVFLTHDIDGLYTAWRTEGLWAAKNFRLDKLLQLLYLEVMQRPAWFNIDDILTLNSENDVRSTFFFLTEKGKNTEGVAHADYDVNSIKIQQLFNRINAQNSEIGLHKSALIHSDFNSELNKLPLNKIASNRYHFLKFQLPEAWQKMEKSGVDLDASLGFAEQFGFRNSYGLPFSPYDFDQKKAMNLVVTPLNIMDGTMELYMKMPQSKIAQTIIDFLNNNRKDAIVSILWHNREFSPFRFEAYLGIYKQVLAYLHEAKMKTVTASEIVADFKSF